MKKLLLIAALIITGLSFQTKAQDYYDRGYDDSYNYGGYDNNDGFGYFYTQLSPYGSWIEFGDGVYGWKPVQMRMGWAPYANGRWLWTSDGWYWDSYEPFGYIVYHYGRWYLDDYYGWIWIPDYQWAPAWVEWRYDNDYIGWSPLPPYAVFSISLGIHFTHSYYSPYSYWNFVRYNNFCDPYVYKYYAGPKYKYRIYSRTKVRNNYGFRNGRVVNRGVDVGFIRERGKIDIRERKIRTVSGLRDINDRNRVTDNEVRTFIPDQKNFTNSRVKDVKIERTTRNTALETSKLEFGRRNIQRTETPVQKKTETRTKQDVNRTPDVRNQKTDPRGTIRQDNKTPEKTTVPDTRVKANERKEVRTPVKKAPEKKDTRTVTSNRSVTSNKTVTPNRTVTPNKTVTPNRTATPNKTEQKIDKRVNERVQQNTQQKKETRAYTPPVQKRTEVNRTPTANRSSGNATVQRQNDSRTKSEQKRETNSGRGRR